MNMLQSSTKQIISISLKLVDLASVVIAFILAAGIVTYPDVGISLEDFFSMRIKIVNFFIFSGFVLTGIIILVRCGLYQSRILSMSQSEVFDIIRATFFVTGVLMIIAEITKISMVNTLFLTIFWLVFSAMIILNRIIYRYTVKALRLKGISPMYVLIVGTNDRAINLARKIDSKPESGYRIQGFVDDPCPKSDPFIKSGYQIIATLDELPSFLRNNPIDEVIVCLPLGAFYHEIAGIIELCENQGIVIRIPTDFFNLKIARAEIEHFENEAMFTMITCSVCGWPLLVKRTFDISISALLLVILSPVFAITGILIKVSSPGPLLFVQDRLGLNKRIFKMYKFRTMIVDAENKQMDLEKFNEASGPVFKIKRDPRIIPIGKLLRKLSIDELPQLFNVLKGDMSLVGPRPLPIRDYQGFSEDWHRRRFSVRPGITCLWQIKGRSNLSFDAWMELDMLYIDDWSLWLDAKILLGTIPAVLKGSGAS